MIEVILYVVGDDPETGKLLTTKSSIIGKALSTDKKINVNKVSGNRYTIIMDSSSFAK